MRDQHSYIACVREGTQDLLDIDRVMPFSAADDDCLKEIDEVLRKHGTTSRFGVSLLHSHFPMNEDELLLEETDVVHRKQTTSIVKRSDMPEGAIFMDRRFDKAATRQRSSRFGDMSSYRNELVVSKLRNDLSLSESDAALLFDDVKRFIALCSTTSAQLAPPRAIDEGWHHFILCTRAYAKFCADYCGRFVHHKPADPAAQGKDYSADRRRTRELAERVFGTLSENWNESQTGARCTHNCGNDD